jgi:hypothetical protein
MGGLFRAVAANSHAAPPSGSSVRLAPRMVQRTLNAVGLWFQFQERRVLRLTARLSAEPVCHTCSPIMSQNQKTLVTVMTHHVDLVRRHGAKVRQQQRPVAAPPAHDETPILVSCQARAGLSG